MNLDLAATGAASGFTAELARVHAALFARAVEHRFMRAAARGAVCAPLRSSDSRRAGVSDAGSARAAMP